METAGPFYEAKSIDSFDSPDYGSAGSSGSRSGEID